MIRQKPVDTFQRPFGSDAPIQAGATPRMQRMGGDIVADVPPGVHADSFSQAVAPFAGQHQLPTGQTISVSMNAPNPNLTLKEWIIRGTLGGVGRMLAWPFKLVGGVIENIAHAIVSLLKWAALILLLPTMIMLGAKLQHQMSSQQTIEGGTTVIMHSGRHVANGIGHGLTDTLPAEEQPAARKATGTN